MVLMRATPGFTAENGVPRCVNAAGVLLLLLLKCTESYGVDLPHRVVTNETKAFVSLPCLASSTLPGPHQVTWYKQRNGRDSVILQMNVTGFMMSSADLQKRVGFGDRWSLLLAAPSVLDSGNYTCEVDGNPPTKKHVELEIQDHSQDVILVLPSAPSLIDAFVVTLLVWIVPVAWLIIFTFERNGMWIKWLRSLRLPEKAKIGCAFLGLVLSFASLVCLSYYLTKGNPELYPLCAVGLCLGTIGIACLVVPLLLLCICNRVQRAQRTKSQAAGLDEQDGKNLLVEDRRGEKPMNDESGTLMKEITRENKHGTFPKDESLPKSKRGTLPKYGSLPQSKRGTLPKYGSLPTPKKGTRPKEGSPPYSKGGTLPRYVPDENDPRDSDSQEDSDDGSVESETTLFQLDWSEITIEKPSLARINDMAFVPPNTLYLCEDHRLYRYDPDTSEFEKLLENVEVHLSALTCDDKGTLFILCRSEKDGWHVASSDLKGEERKHRVRFILRGFPARYNWLTYGHEGLYTTEKKANQVEIYSKTGKRLRSFGEAVLGTPTCIVQNNRYQTFVADSKNGNVYVFDKGGKFLSSFGERSPADIKRRLSGCHRVTVSEDGRIFVAIATSNVILVFDSNFAPLAWLTVGTESSGPISSIIYANKSLYVAQDDNIRVYSEKENIESPDMTEDTG